MSWFAERLLAWYDAHGRRDLPWRGNQTPYRVWVSEIMLQQTQAATVRPYFARFVTRFPTLRALAHAERDEVLRLWGGLGYYARARNLHRAAKLAQRGLPDTLEGLCALPGIGRSTAGAILAIAFGHRAAILDGNAKRALARFHGIVGHPSQRHVEQALWRKADAHTPAERPGDYAQAIMDFGATLCRRRNPACSACPVAGRCVAFATGRQSELPAPRVRRLLPERRARAFLLIDRRGACLLERRPDAGVWGGLWSPPERPLETDVAAFSREWSIDVERALAAPPVRHTFTHYRFIVTPHRLWVRRRPARLRTSERHIWHRLGAGRKLALSALAEKLMAGLDEGIAPR